MSSYKTIPRDEPRNDVYNAIYNILFKTHNTHDYTQNLRHSALSIIVKKSSINKPILIKEICDSLESEYGIFPESMRIIAATIGRLQMNMSSYIGIKQMRFGAGKNNNRKAAYFLRVGKESGDASVRKDAEIIQQLFLDVLDVTRQELEISIGR